MVSNCTRRDVLKGLAGLMAACPLTLHALADTKPHPSSKPNLLFLLMDDLRFDALGCMGNTMVHTPHIDQLAQQGTRFTEHFCTTSICMSSRATIFTGQFTCTHQITDFQTPLSATQFQTSYPALLRQAGYQTGFIGKWGVGPVPEDQFDFFKGFPGQGWYFSKDPNEKRHLTTIMRDQALEFLDTQNQANPFCLSISFKSPHCQDGDPKQFLYDPAYEELYQEDEFVPARTATEAAFHKLPPFLQDSEARNRWKLRFSTPEQMQQSVKGYYRLISGVDRCVGDLVVKLEEKGLRDNTVIILTSDNGFYLGEHGLAGKWFMHEESIRLPLIIMDPRHTPAQSTNAHMTLTIDMAPTLLNLAGIPIPQTMQGKSLVPLLQGEPAAWRKEFYYEHLFEHPAIPKTEGIRTQRWKWVTYPDHPGADELYDLRHDPLEETNLVQNPEYQAVRDRLTRRWNTWKTRLAQWHPHGTEPWRDPE
ncbi:MAG: sulfatase [bacterium]|jgi:arylsulfatase A-like enzyme|nr:sulfatase [bacterium]